MTWVASSRMYARPSRIGPRCARRSPRRPSRSSLGSPIRRPDRRVAGLSRVARRGQFHPARLPRSCTRRTRHRSPSRRGIGARDLARPARGVSRPAGARAGRVARSLVRRGSSSTHHVRGDHTRGHHQGEYALDCPSPELPRLHRGAALRGRRADHRRARLPGPPRLRGLPGRSQGHPALAPQDRGCHGACRVRLGGSLRPGVTVRPRVLSARRALPDLAGRALRDRLGDPASARTAARAAVRAPRPLRPVSVVPGIRAA